MPPAQSELRQAASGYMERTHRPLNCLAFILPLLVAYEVGGLLVGHRVLAIHHLSVLLEMFGATGRLLPPLLVIVVMIIWHVLTKEKWRVDGGTLLGMLAESILLVLPLVLMMAVADLFIDAPMLAAQSGQPVSAGPAQRVLITVGAGLYEEFIFRLAGIALLLLLCVDVFHMPKRYAIVAAVIVTAVMFSLYHCRVFGAVEGEIGWGWNLFVMRALAGAYLAVVYVARGFGISVGVHICYNLVVLWPKLTAAG